jgi:hypothetical protein
MTRFEERRRAIESALVKAGTAVESGAAAWTLAADALDAPVIHVQWDESWIALSTAANGASPAGADGLWTLLRAQGELPATCRYALAPRAGLRVVGEVVADGGAELGARCRELVRGLVAARAERPAPRARAAVAAPDRARDIVAEVGWQVHERADGRLAGTLPGVEGWTAELAGEAGGETGDIRLSVELASLRAGDTTRRALAELLLAAGHFLRFTRPGVEEDGVRSVVLFETRLPGDATPDELRHALGALATACGTCGDEVRALEDPALAAEYLVRGRTP